MSNMGNKEIMSANLKYYIALSGKDRRELSKIWGFPYSTVSDWVNGYKYPRIDKIQIMADYFGVAMADLIEDKKEKPINGDGLSEKKKALLNFALSVPDDKAEMILRVMKSIVEAD